MGHQPPRGSDKLKAACTSMATLTPEQISQVAGGVSLSQVAGYTLVPGWWIRGQPAHWGLLDKPGLPVLPGGLPGLPGSH
jgi:hypothetical protein